MLFENGTESLLGPRARKFFSWSSVSSIVKWVFFSTISQAGWAGVWHTVPVGAEEDPASVCVRVLLCYWLRVILRLPTSDSNSETCFREEVRSGINILKISP